jgi:hypothetical protein
MRFASLPASLAMSLLFVTLAEGFTPDRCDKGTVDWNPIASAEAMSGFCGILAGFVFAAVVMVIGEKNPTGGDGHASRGLRLLLPSFFGLAVAAYLYALTAGELVCRRALTEQLFAGAILAADAIVVILSLAWLLLAYQRNQHGEVRFFRGLILVTALFSLSMLTVSSVGFHNAVLERKAAGWADAMVWTSGIAFMAVVWRCWRRPTPLPPPGAPPNWQNEVFLNKRVTVSSWTTLLVGGVLAAASAAAVGIPYDSWDMPTWLVYTMSEAALVIPATIIASGMLAVPRE